MKTVRKRDRLAEMQAKIKAIQSVKKIEPLPTLKPLEFSLGLPEIKHPSAQGNVEAAGPKMNWRSFAQTGGVTSAPKTDTRK